MENTQQKPKDRPRSAYPFWKDKPHHTLKTSEVAIIHLERRVALLERKAGIPRMEVPHVGRARPTRLSDKTWGVLTSKKGHKVGDVVLVTSRTGASWAARLTNRQSERVFASERVQFEARPAYLSDQDAILKGAHDDAFDPESLYGWCA